MQISIPKFWQSSVFKKPSILSEKLKTLMSFNYQTLIFFVEILLTFPTYQHLKRVFRTFLFCLELELITKIKKYLTSKDSQKPGLPITQDLNTIKKILNIFLQIFCRNRSKVSEKINKLYGSWTLSKFSIFQTNNLVSWK